VWEIFPVGQKPAPPTGKRQRPDQQMRLPTHAPRTRRIGQFDPVPLGFLARRVRDDRRITTFDRLAGLTVRTQAQRSDRRGQARIRPREPQLDDLVEQRRRPQMRITSQPLPAVRHERLDQQWRSPRPLARLSPARQMRTNGLAITAQMPSDR
jgi:hypothetical protein